MSDEEREEEDSKIDALAKYIRNLGLDRMARDISDERFARRVVESKMVADYYSTNLEVWKLKEDRVVQEEVALVTGLFDKTSAYNNIVLTLGYAGFFAIWNNTRDSLSFTQNAWIGAFLGISLVVFIVWTLINSVIMVAAIGEKSSALNREFETRQDQVDALIDANVNLQKGTLKIQKHWPLVFGFTVFFGLGAGLYLLSILISQMVGFDWRSIICFVPA